MQFHSLRLDFNSFFHSFSFVFIHFHSFSTRQPPRCGARHERRPRRTSPQQLKLPMTSHRHETVKQKPFQSFYIFLSLFKSFSSLQLMSQRDLLLQILLKSFSKAFQKPYLSGLGHGSRPRIPHRPRRIGVHGRRPA